MKRLFDIVISFLGLIFLSPLFILIVIIMKANSKGGIIYTQLRVGINNKDFSIFKFRTMYVDSDKLGLLTIGGRDPRVTKLGYYLRKFKLDELPQLLNVLIGDMSLVGPRPEVRKYVDLYTQEQMMVLNVRPGITDMASIAFRNENDLLSEQVDPDSYYIDVIMPKKIQLNLDYLKERNLIKDIGVIVKTFLAII
jgi:lipopolysaccharide/colanic/teichoic acid biosynthesis glycosyltransferase